MNPVRRRPQAAEMAMRGAALAPLSRTQKRHLILLMKRCWATTTTAAAADTSEGFEEWRVRQCLIACGRRLSQAINQDFLLIYAHFSALLGQTGHAFNALMRSQDEPRTHALNRLRIECRKAADVLPGAMSYIRGMLKNRSIILEDASAKQIWHAIFTLRRKANLERKKRQQPMMSHE